MDVLSKQAVVDPLALKHLRDVISLEDVLIVRLKKADTRTNEIFAAFDLYKSMSGLHSSTYALYDAHQCSAELENVINDMYGLFNTHRGFPGLTSEVCEEMAKLCLGIIERVLHEQGNVDLGMNTRPRYLDSPDLYSNLIRRRGYRPFALEFLKEIVTGFDIDVEMSERFERIINRLQDVEAPGEYVDQLKGIAGLEE